MGSDSAEATLESPLAAEDRKSFDFLMQLDPHFNLRFDDASTVLVKVVEAGVGLGPGCWTHETLDPEDLRTDISWS